jgi:Tfp pilus assembly protein PilF
LDTRAVVLLTLDQTEAAARELERVVGNDPNGLRCYHLALAYEKLDRRSEAVEAMRRAVEEFELTAESILPFERRAFRQLSQRLADIGKANG